MRCLTNKSQIEVLQIVSLAGFVLCVCGVFVVCLRPMFAVVVIVAVVVVVVLCLLI